ncbi:hypothetical protein ACHAWF_002612 [Thalassiosira exigua]
MATLPPLIWRAASSASATISLSSRGLPLPRGRRTRSAFAARARGSIGGRVHDGPLPSAAAAFFNNDDDDGAHSYVRLSDAYERRVGEGALLFDPRQMRAARKLTRLQAALGGYDHSSFLEGLERWEESEKKKQERKEELHRWGGDEMDEQKQSPEVEEAPPLASISVPRGFYIHGEVGTGKSLLLDSFHDHACTLAPGKKRRIHFHSFLQDIHRRVHDLNKALLRRHGRSFHVDVSRERNPIVRVAEQISQEVTLLCIDEFQVTDVADAMILSQFFGELWRRGVVVVATSNRPPRDLYEGGLNRGYFLPFLDLLEKYCVVHRLGDDRREGRGDEPGGGATDYRRIRLGVDAHGSDKECGEYYHLTGKGDGRHALERLDELFRSFRKCSEPPTDGLPLRLRVHFNRTISIRQYHSDVIARFTFDELCTAELGSSDYHAIANHFHIVIIEMIPQLTLKHPDRARRFITLIDELYEAGTPLACSAAEVPDRLFLGKSSRDDGCGNRSHDEGAEAAGNMHAVDVAQVQGTAVGELASVKELSFAFDRAASRLLEMCSETWWEEKGAAQPNENNG